MKRIAKINLIINKLDSRKVYTNKRYEISLSDGNIIIKDLEHDRLMSTPIPDLTDSNEILVCHDEYSIMNTIVVHKPTNKVKKLFWKYGFRNCHYCKNRAELKRRLSPKAELVYQSENVLLYSIENAEGVKLRNSAHLAYVDFGNVRPFELDTAMRQLKDSKMEPMLESNYKFN